MGASDKTTRAAVLPMRLPVWGFNSVESSDTDISNAAVPGDLINLIGQNGSPAKQNPVRFLRPYQGQIERAFLTFQLSYAGNQSGGQDGLYIGRGLFNDGSSGDLSDRQLVISEAQIKADHKLITGSANPIYPFFSNRQYFIDGLDITPLISNRGGPALPNQYRDYAFIIVIMFEGITPSNPGTPSPTGWPYHLYDFRIQASALMEA